MQIQMKSTLLYNNSVITEVFADKMFWLFSLEKVKLGVYNHDNRLR